MPAREHLLYENAPLIEVIAELRWEIQRIESLPDAWIDPHFAMFDKEITSKLSSEGYSTIEPLAAPNVPIELLANSVIKRFRSEPNKWPLFQVGPGVFTANTVPPYKGWTTFRPTLAKGLDYLFDCYPLAERYLSFRQFELRYLNAFTDRHGFKAMRSFLSDYMNIALTMPDAIWSQASEDGQVVIKSEIGLPLKKQPGNTGIIRFGSGRSSNQDAVLLELSVRHTGHIAKQPAIMDWMDAAHMTIRSWFQCLTSSRMKEKMMPLSEAGKK